MRTAQNAFWRLTQWICQRMSAPESDASQKPRTSQIEAPRYQHHSRHIYRCDAQRASVVKSENSMRAAAYNNPNRLGTHFPRKMAFHRRLFLIHCPELDTNLI